MGSLWQAIWWIFMLTSWNKFDSSYWTFILAYMCIGRGINRGYYTPARGYEFYLRVFNSIVEHEKIKYISISGHVMFCLFYYINILMTTFLRIFRRLPTPLRRFPKIFQNCSEGRTKVSEHFFGHFPKITEDIRK